jgi:hypothetical protein
MATSVPGPWAIPSSDTNPRLGLNVPSNVLRDNILQRRTAIRPAVKTGPRDHPENAVKSDVELILTTTPGQIPIFAFNLLHHND